MCEKYDINENKFSVIVDDDNLECSNSYSSSNALYNYIKNNKYIFGCFGYNKDLVLVKFNSSLKIEHIIENNEYYYNEQNCFSLSIIKIFNDKNYSIFAGCENKGVLYKNDLPGGLSEKEQETQRIPFSTNNIIFKVETTNEYIETNSAGKYQIISTNKFIETDSTSLYQLKTTINQKEITTSHLMYHSTNFVVENSKEIISNNYSSLSIIPSTLFIKSYLNMQYSNKLYETIENLSIQKNETCSEEYLYHNIYTKECLKSCSAENLLNKICKINSVSNSNINELTENIRNIITQENITSNTNIVIEANNTVFQLITNKKMSENENSNMSIIDLGECEQILLDEYKLDYLLILKIDTKLDENTAVILNYEVYNPKTHEKLNLSICINTTIYTYSNYYPSEESLNKIKQLNKFGYDLYDINNEFYQDLCSSFTSENGTDILLSDRKSDFYENI